MFSVKGFGGPCPKSDHTGIQCNDNVLGLGIGGTCGFDGNCACLDGWIPSQGYTVCIKKSKSSRFLQGGPTVIS